ncbi:hypothetical protein CCFV1_ORF060 [Cotesia congregata filamentous virus 1]|uniref:Uncharacterized protein n=1 Tax=Cotesia congregata filamentous virus 1 TaxID=3064291 RepID=A0ABC8QR38_9VIRU|nr:hypothetical protein CCFV1_ORF060 [Cotesia congregata filamentous virus 1]
MEIRPLLSVSEYNQLRPLLDERSRRHCDQLINSDIYMQSPHSIASIHYAATLNKKLKEKYAAYTSPHALLDRPEYDRVNAECDRIYDAMYKEQAFFENLYNTLDWCENHLDYVIHSKKEPPMKKLINEAEHCRFFLKNRVLTKTMYFIGSIFSYPVNLDLAKQGGFFNPTPEPPPSEVLNRINLFK